MAPAILATVCACMPTCHTTRAVPYSRCNRLLFSAHMRDLRLFLFLLFVVVCRVMFGWVPVVARAIVEARLQYEASYDVIKFVLYQFWQRRTKPRGTRTREQNESPENCGLERTYYATLYFSVDDFFFRIRKRTHLKMMISLLYVWFASLVEIRREAEWAMGWKTKKQKNGPQKNQ